MEGDEIYLLVVVFVLLRWELIHFLPFSKATKKRKIEGFFAKTTDVRASLIKNSQCHQNRLA